MWDGFLMLKMTWGCTKLRSWVVIHADILETFETSAQQRRGRDGPEECSLQQLPQKTSRGYIKESTSNEPISYLSLAISEVLQRKTDRPLLGASQPTMCRIFRSTKSPSAKCEISKFFSRPGPGGTQGRPRSCRPFIRPQCF